ncbi:MAG: hypothetical protein M3R65_04600 [Gemmatimonadota bacterium]|nr:hypothetical protein [Gemmatimonadota bacterium]
MRAALVVAIAASVQLGPAAARAQDAWVGIGAIGGAAMFMDTTSIVRTSSLRTVWVKSIDPKPRQFLAGGDTLTFDTVVGRNEFDCVHRTRRVLSVQYLLRDSVVLNVPVTHDEPARVDTRSFFGAIYADLCRPAR